MKRKIVSILAVLFFMVTTGFANRNDASSPVVHAFNNSFANARAVNWERFDGYYKASFKLNEQYLTAFYSEEAELIAVSKNILSTALPINLQLNLNKIIDGYWISELFEFSSAGETRYCVTLENAAGSLVLESNGAHGWEIFKRIDKTTE